MTSTNHSNIKPVKAEVLILNDRAFNSGYGGQASFIKNLHPFLEKKYTLTYLNLSENCLKQNIIPIRLAYFFKVLFFLLKYKKKIDLVLSHTPEASYVVTHFRIPIVHIFHGNTNPLQKSTFWYGRYFKWIFRHFEIRIIKKASMLFTVGEHRPDAFKLYNPVATLPIRRLTFAERKDFIYAGRLENVKNVDKIIRSYGLLPDEIRGKHKLRIVGTGRKENSLRKLVSELNLKEDVVFHGQVNNNEAVSIIRKSLFLMIASSHEGFPMVIAESLTVGTPVISTDVGDIKSVVKDGYNGYLLPLEFTYTYFYEKVVSLIENFEHLSVNAVKSSVIFNARNVAEYLISNLDQIIKPYGELVT